MFQIFIILMGGNTLTFSSPTSNITSTEIGKFVFKKTGLPTTWQRFTYSHYQFYGNKEEKIQKFHIQNLSTIHLHYTFHGTGCSCNTCYNKGILLRNGKRLN
jgi:hypothetical protein